jgi:HTH-type transcriptional regulator, sugar sensing transcriptional regulator
VSNYNNFSAIGLESRDMRVYETLYRLGKASLRTLAQETGLNRGTVYEIIKKLLDLGMVTFTQIGERRRYTAAEPEILTTLIQEGRDRLQSLEASSKDYSAQLRDTQQVNGKGYPARFFEGDEGVAAILRDVLQTVKTLEPKSYDVISSQRVSSFIYNNFRGYSRRRVKLGLFVRVLSDAAAVDPPVLAERRQLTAGKTSLDSYTLIYGNKLALISLSETNVLSGIIVTDAGIAGTQREIFERLWQQAAATPTAPAKRARSPRHRA